MANNANVFDYLDFEISISEARTDGTYNLRAVSGATNAGSCEETMSLDVDALLGRLHMVSKTARPSQVLKIRDGDADAVLVSAPTAADDFGKEVCKALLTGSIKTLFERTWGIALAEGKGVRIRLYIGTKGDTMGKVAALPWEMMSSEERGTLALNAKTVFVRSMDVMQPRDAPSIATGLRILVIASSPAGYPALNLEEESARLKADWGGAPDVHVDFESGSLEVLSSRLANEHFHVIHFMGHGQFNATTGKGALLFEGEGKVARPVDAEEFARYLINVSMNPPRLVFLNACKSATTSDVLSTRPFGGMAQGLVAEGVPAVIAMQFPVGDKAAIQFSNRFYERAALGFPIDAAVTIARGQMGPEWATPVLYLRAKDGALFQKEASAPMADVSAANAMPTPMSNVVAAPPLEGGSPGSAASATASGFTVFLCPPTEPDDNVVGEIQRALKKLGVTVVTVESSDPESFTQRVQSLAQSADLAVHIMGPTPGMSMGNGGIRSYPWEALFTAYTSARSQLVLQSGSFEIDGNQYPEYAAYMKTFDSTLRAAERMEYARVGEVEMAHLVAEKVKDMMKRAAQAAGGRVKSVFIDMHANDGATMFSLQQYLQQQHDIVPQFMASSGEPDSANLKKFAQLVAENPLCVVVFGNSPLNWTRERVQAAANSKFSAEANTVIGVLAVEPKDRKQLNFQGFAKVSVTPPTFDPRGARRVDCRGERPAMSADATGEVKEPRAPRSNPYVGLSPFTSEDSVYFFGRREQTTALLGILGEHRFLPLVGGSGSGKSSLVRAGLIPKLEAGFLVHDSDRWRIAIMRPGDGPIANLAVELVRQFDDRRPNAAGTLATEIGKRRADAVVEYVQERRKELAASDREPQETPGQPPRDRKENLLIVVDQFEEIFSFRLAKGSATSDNREDRAEFARRNKEAADFVDTLLKVAQDDVPIHVVITMRTDFLGDCDLFFGLPEAMNAAQYLIPRMSRQALREAVAGPPQIFGASVAPRLVDMVLNDLGARQDRLPVLQHALLRTWDAWSAGGRIGPLDLEHFAAAGGLDKALEQDANAAAAGFDDAVVARIFRALTDTDVRKRRIRHPAFVTELEAVAGAPPETVRAIIERFKGDNRNFLYESTDGATGKQRIDISHESLIRQWGKLTAWVDQERDARDQYLKLVREAREWEKHAKEPLTGADLALAVQWKKEFDPQETWAKRYEQDPGDGVRRSDYALMVDFIETSATLAKRSRRIRRNVVAAAVTILAVLTLTAVRQARNANTAREEALDLTKLSIANQLVASDPLSAGLLALELKPPAGFDLARASLLQKVAASALPEQIIDSVGQAAIDSAGTHLAVALTNGTIELRDLAHPEQATLVLRPTGPERVTSIAVSSDARFVAVGSPNGQVYLWVVASPSKPRVWETRLGAVRNLAFDASGSYLMAKATPLQGYTPYVFVWETNGKEQPRVQGETCYAQFSPSQAGVLVTGCGLHEGFILQPYRICTITAEGKEWKLLPAGTAFAGFRGDGQIALLAHRIPATNELQLDMYDIARGRTTYSFKTETNSVKEKRQFATAISSDGSMVAVATNTEVMIYRADSKWGPTTIVRDGGDEIAGLIGFSKDDSQLLVKAKDDIVRIYDTDASRRGKSDAGLQTPPPILLLGNTNVLRSVATTGGNTILTVNEDNSARVWKPPFWRDRQILRGAKAFAPTGEASVAENGSRRFTAYEDGTALLQDLTGKFAVTEWNEPGIDVGVFDENGDYLIISRRQAPPLLRSADGKTTPLVDSERSYPSRARFTTDNKFVYARTGTHVGLWDRTDGHFVGRPIVLKENESVIAAANAELFVTQIDHALRFRHANDDVSTAPLIDGADSGGFSRDGKYFMAMGRNAVLYTAAGTKVRDVTKLKTAMSWSFSHDGKRLAIEGENSLVNIWSTDTAKHEPLIVLRGHTGEVVDVRFSKDDSTIVSSALDGTVRIWSAYGKGQPIVLHVEDARRVHFTPDHDVITTGAPPQLWALQPSKLIARIDSAITSCLSVDFRMANLGERRDEAQKNRDKCERRRGRPGAH